MQNMINNIRHDIQFLRTFAVLSVIAYHFKLPGFSGGFVGVDIFFVISGYLIFGQIQTQLSNNSFSLKRFFEARLRRIFPALVFMCLLVAIWGWFYDLPRYYVGSTKNTLATLFFVSNYAFSGTQGYFDAAANTKALLHTWSLSVEGQFYLILPFVILVLLKWGKRKIQLALILIFGVSLSIALYQAYRMHWLSSRSVAYEASKDGFYFISSRAWEFLTGAIVVNLNINCKPKYCAPILLASLLGLCLNIMVVNGEQAWPNLWTLLPVFSAAAFIGVANRYQNNPVIAAAITQKIGDMSYSLYLWHWPVWVFANQLSEAPINNAGKVALLALVAFLSYISWRWVEKPYRDRSRVNSVFFIKSVLVALVSCILFGWFIIKTHGYAKRFPDYIARASIQGWEHTPRKECFRTGENTKKDSNQFCTFGTSSEPKDATMMLWGDSHANQYLTPVTKAAQSTGTTGLIANMSGCRAFIESDAVHYEDYPHCKAFNYEVYGFLSVHPAINTVILGRIWSDSDETIDRTVLLAKDLISRGKKVILISPLPVPGMHVENVWSMRQIKAGRAIETITIENSAAVRQSEILLKLKTRLVPELKSGKLFLIDPTQKLCDESFCYAVKDGVAIFKDISHLTELAAQKMEPDFKDAFIWAKKAQ